jgi:hypothetical protein
MNIEQQLAAIVRSGITLAVRDGEVGVIGPASIVTPDVVMFLIDNKPEAMAWVQSKHATGYTIDEPAVLNICPHCEALFGSLVSRECPKCEFLRIREKTINERNQ